MINIKNLDPNKVKIDEKSCKNILTYYIGYVAIKNFTYKKIVSVNPLYLIISKINGCIGKSNGNEYLTLVLTSESKDMLKTYEGLWNQIRGLIRSVTNNSSSYDENT